MSNTILLIEDDDFDAEVIMRGFKSQNLGNTIVRAMDGIEALELLRGENGRDAIKKPFTILLDISMPRMNGFEFLDALREDRELKDSAVFMLSTSNDERDRARAYRGNVIGYLNKAELGSKFSQAASMLNDFWTSRSSAQISNLTPDKIKLLIVDDNDLDQENIIRHLSHTPLDIDICVVDNAQDMFATMKKDAFDCIILDYLIPPTDGLSMLRELSAMMELPAVVMTTGMGDETIAVNAMKLGVQDYLPKDNITPESLMHAITHAIQENQIQKKKNDQHLMLERLSFYDELTGLANRNLFIDRLVEAIKSARREGKHFAVILMDLNGFKAVNDNYGHHVGDQLLKEIGARLSKALRDSDTVARLGGDEFTFLLPNAGDKNGASITAEKINRVISEPFHLEEHVVEVGASVGIALYPEHGEDHNTLLQNADAAMYHAKKNKLGHFVYTNKDFDEHDQHICEQLPDLVYNDDLVLCYQPLINLQTSKVSGAEVLIRWKHPELGLLPPQEFIPVAEQSTVIRDLTYRVLYEALRQHRSWLDQGLRIPLSINLSSRLLVDHDLITRVSEMLRFYSIAAENITFEITESAFISNHRRVRKMLEGLAAEGIRISVDDFGTGYSSLQYLREFPIDEIKIDRSFVGSIFADVTTEHIIKAILELGKAVNAKTVAEGIESEEVWGWLLELGCVGGQGFYISHPVEAKAFERWFVRWNEQAFDKRLESA